MTSDRWPPTPYPFVSPNGGRRLNYQIEGQHFTCDGHEYIPHTSVPAIDELMHSADFDWSKWDDFYEEYGPFHIDWTTRPINPRPAEV